MDSSRLEDEGSESGPDEIELIVITREGRRHVGTIADTTATVVVAAFPARTHSTLCIAEPVQIELAGSKPNETIRAAARVISTRLEGDECLGRFRVSEEDAKALSRARFRNRSLRIGVGSKARVRLDVGREAEPLTGALRDISESGMAVFVDFATDRELVLRQASVADASWWLPIEIRLEGNDAPLSLVVSVRYRTLAAANVKYGLQIDLDHTLAAFPGEPPRMTEHLLRYQAAMLGVNRDRRSA